MNVNRQELVECAELAKDVAAVMVRMILKHGLPVGSNVLDLADALQGAEPSQEMVDIVFRLLRWARKQRDPEGALFTCSLSAGCMVSEMLHARRVN